jgi:O-acetyl-ADP-ribose deacetylase (regulator of RNase III)
VVTGAGHLPARFVIHAVAPRYGGRPRDAELLRSAYAASLRCAAEVGARSVAFPSLGTGAYGYPLVEAAPIAVSTVVDAIDADPGRFERIAFVLFSAADLAVYERLFAERFGG